MTTYKMQPKNEDYPKNEDNLMSTTREMKTTSKKKTASKMKMTSYRRHFWWNHDQLKKIEAKLHRKLFLRFVIDVKILGKEMVKTNFDQKGFDQKIFWSKIFTPKIFFCEFFLGKIFSNLSLICHESFFNVNVIWMYR